MIVSHGDRVHHVPDGEFLVSPYDALLYLNVSSVHGLYGVIVGMAPITLVVP